MARRTALAATTATHARAAQEETDGAANERNEEQTDPGRVHVMSLLRRTYSVATGRKRNGPPIGRPVPLKVPRLAQGDALHALLAVGGEAQEVHAFAQCAHVNDGEPFPGHGHHLLS